MPLRFGENHLGMMDPTTLVVPPGTTSRLRIHGGSGHGRDDFEGVRRKPTLWRGWWVRLCGEAVRCTLEVRDLPGHRLLTLSHAGDLIDMVLPTGTYHVTTQTGECRRRYTVVLEPDATTELHLQPGKPPHRH